jgi:DNA processing protein
VIAVGLTDARYPRGLLDLRDPPDPLWIDGKLSAFHARAISIVGTRRMTPYGARVARELARACAEAGAVVISGLAQGVDSAAHEGALEAGGSTVAVLGAGIPSYLGEARGRRRRLAHAIRSCGALVSEFPPDAPARKWTFAQRDATIAALGLATVVVEAPLGSGALITAAHAGRLGRTVYAVPGPIGATASAGANGLLASGEARALTAASTLLDALGVASVGRSVPSSDLDARILDALAGAPAGPDALARRLGKSTKELSSHLARLLIRGEVLAGGDGRLARR